MSSFKYKKTLPHAATPKKGHPSDSGFDLYLMEKIKEENGVYWYDTGIAVEPPEGYYFEVVGRSSISKSGYMIANNVGIIDQSYRGSVKVALIKVNNEASEIELPCRLVQLIPRQYIHLDPIEVDELNNTIRGDGGFGSTGKS
jgi:dUTP pyrophosphatase